MSEPIDQVDFVGDKTVTVVCRNKAHQKRLAVLGGKHGLIDRSKWEFTFSGEQALAHLLGALRDLGLPFAGGTAGWPPAEVFADLRDKGLLKGEFAEVLYTGREPRIQRSEVAPSAGRKSPPEPKP